MTFRLWNDFSIKQILSHLVVKWRGGGEKKGNVLSTNYYYDYDLRQTLSISKYSFQIR